MSITLDYKGKLVLVTGGGRGIGLAITTALAKGTAKTSPPCSERYVFELKVKRRSLAGADVAISYTSKDATLVASQLSDAHRVKVTAFQCEVTKSDQVDRLLEDVEKMYGKKVDIGVANAGQCFMVPTLLV